MVDDLEIARRVQPAPTPHGQTNQPIPAVGPGGPSFSVADAVQLSAEARDMMEQDTNGQTVAEAWLREMTKPPTPAEMAEEARRARKPGGDDEVSALLEDNLNSVVKDMGWLFEALGTKEPKLGQVLEALRKRAAEDGVGTTPPLPEVMARAAQTSTLPALYVENLDVTLHKDKVADVQVQRVALTTVHPSMQVDERDRPVIVDVGGAITERMQIAPDATARRLLEDGKRPDDLRHALLIVRQGGQLHAEGTIRLKLDALLAIKKV